MLDTDHLVAAKGEHVSNKKAADNDVTAKQGNSLSRGFGQPQPTVMMHDENDVQPPS